MRFVFAILVTLAFAATASAQQRQDRQDDRSGVFDFYVLSLSWSPTFCAASRDSRNDQQCGASKNFRFIVHGLWPQYERGYPDFCDAKEPARVPTSLGEPLFDIMPSMGLIGHQWRKHGSCSGLTQRDYFAKTRAAYEKIKLPADIASGDKPATFSADQIEDRFVSANPGMTRRGIAASCEGRQLDEIRICLTKDLAFRDCVEVDRGGCRASSITIPSAR